MVMSKIATTVLAVLLAGAGAGVYWQQGELRRLEAENRALQAEVEAAATAAPAGPGETIGATGAGCRRGAGGGSPAAAPVAGEAGGAASPTEISPAGPAGAASTAELLRLRSEVGQLRRQVRAAAGGGGGGAAGRTPEAGRGAGGGAGVAGGTAPGQAQSNPEDNLPYVANLNTSVPKDQTLLAGGWNTETGKRMLLLLTPEYGGANQAAGQIALRSTFVQVPEEALAGLGLGDFQTGGRASDHTSTLAPAEAAALLAKLQATAGSQVLPAPLILTPEGREAEITIGPTGQGSSVSYIANLAADQSGLNVAIKTKLPALVPTGGGAAPPPGK